jgi:glycosyltransferase involved in cell wall biosynthesis
VVLESLAAGRAVVASRVGAIPEVILHGINGFLCEYGDIDSFFECVERLRTNTTLQSSIEANAKECSRDNFGLNAMMQSYRKLLAPDSIS